MSPNVLMFDNRSFVCKHTFGLGIYNVISLIVDLIRKVAFRVADFLNIYDFARALHSNLGLIMYITKLEITIKKVIGLPFSTSC